MKKVTIIGGGGTGHALAADLSRRGFTIALCEEPEFGASLAPARDAGGVEICGALEPGFVAVDTVTTELDAAVSGADIVLISTVANRHAGIARAIRPYLADGQAILIGPDNGGSLIFAKEFRNSGMNRDVLLGGMGGNYYPCRLVGPAKAYVGMPAGKRKVAAFPAVDTARLIANLEGLFELVPGINVLEMALSTPNIPNHLAGAILNTGAIESSQGRFNLFRDGLTPSVLKCIDAVVAERNAILKAFGFGEINSPMLRKVAQLDEHPELELFRDLGGPAHMQHRYVTEDAETGISLLISLGRLIGIDTPVSEGLLSIASAINRTDYYGSGRTVTMLDLQGSTIWEINLFLETGSAGTQADVPPLI